MKIALHIDRLVLDGLPVTALQRPKLQAAIESELARLLSLHGLSDELRGGAAVPYVRAGVIQLGHDNQPATLGRKIAGAVHEGIGNPGREKATKLGVPNPGGTPR
jgi:hypothetical protein